MALLFELFLGLHSSHTGLPSQCSATTWRWNALEKTNSIEEYRALAAAPETAPSVTPLHPAEIHDLVLRNSSCHEASGRDDTRIRDPHCQRWSDCSSNPHLGEVDDFQFPESISRQENVGYTLDVTKLQGAVQDGSVGIGVDIRGFGSWHNVWGCSMDLCKGPFGLECPLVQQFKLRGVINVPGCAPPGRYRLVLTLDSSDRNKEIVCGSLEYTVK